jgi:hypothetical protein
MFGILIEKGIITREEINAKIHKNNEKTNDENEPQGSRPNDETPDGVATGVPNKEVD